jgi:hypothetical protein
MSAVCEATGADVSEVALAIGMDSRSHHICYNYIKMFGFSFKVRQPTV